METRLNSPSNNELTRKDAHEILTNIYSAMSALFMFFAGATFILSGYFFTENKLAGASIFLLGFLGCLITSYRFRKKLTTRIKTIIND